MHKKNIIILTLTIIITLLFSSCFLQKTHESEPETKPFLETDADNAALTYLKEKYGEEFEIIQRTQMSDGVMFSGNTWYEIRVIKKSEKNSEIPKKYIVCVSDDGKNTILGDTVICDYYNVLYDEYVTPIIAKEMGETPFVVIVDSEGNSFTNKFTDQGVKPEVVIPKSLDDEDGAFKKSDFVYDIFISESDDKGQIKDVCKKIHDSLTEENYRWAYIIVISNEEFKALYTAEDKYLERRTHINTTGKKIFEVE